VIQFISFVVTLLLWLIQKFQLDFILNYQVFSHPIPVSVKTMQVTKTQYALVAELADAPDFADATSV